MFKERFEQLLQSRHLTPYRVAKDLGMSQGLMNEYKNGVKLPSVQNLIKIADQLGCSVDYLLGRADSPEPNTPAPEDPFVAEFVRVFAALSPADQSKAIAYLLQLQRGEG